MYNHKSTNIALSFQKTFSKKKKKKTFTSKKFLGKRTKYYHFNDFTSAILISNMRLVILLLAIKLIARLNIFKYNILKLRS